MSKLPDCDRLFKKFFDRWYSDDDRRRKRFPATRPDMMEVPEYVGKSMAQVSPLTPRARAKVSNQITTMQVAAGADWKTYLTVKKPVSLEWVEAFDKHFDEPRVRAVIKSSDPTDFSNEYLVITCELGAVLGRVFCRLNRRLQWLYDWPYWESAVFDPSNGNVIPIFHWAIMKMSGYGVNDGLAAKVHACLRLLDGKPLRGSVD